MAGKLHMDGLDALALAVSQSSASQMDSSMIDPSLRDTTHNPPHQPVNIEDIINMPSFLHALAQEGVPPTPQQTRSGRISRPPLITRDVLTVLERLGAAGIGLVATSNIHDRSSSRNENEVELHGDWGYGEGVQGYHASTLANPRSQVESRDPVGVKRAKSERGKKRSVSAMTGAEDEVEERDRGGTRGSSGLPAWPNPPGGRGGRKAMPAEEMLARRRARNKVAALESRKKKKEEVKGMQMSLLDREQACLAMEGRCRDLENEVVELRRFIAASGLTVPTGITATNTSHISPAIPRMVTPRIITSAPIAAAIPQKAAPSLYTEPNATLPDIASDLSGIDLSALAAANATMDTPDFSVPFDTAAFSAFFDFPNENEEDDADFLPGSSPRAESEDEDRTPKSTNKTSRGKRSKGTTRAAMARVEEEEEDDEEDDEFEDDDVEDEDLFLPIEDVEIPDGFKEREKEDDAMKSLGVEDQGQFAELIERVVEAGKTKEGVTPDVLEKLKVLIGLAGRGVSGSK